MDRRELLTGSAGGALLLSFGRPLPAKARDGTPISDVNFPMPAPRNSVLPPLPRSDPSRTRLELGWHFHEGDIHIPPPEGHHETYLSVKAGNARGAAAPDYDDSDWDVVRLPHDWASAQPFVETANVSQGYRPRGIGWYRRRFRLDPADDGKKLELHFDGIASNATIWINGNRVAHSWSAYSSVYVDLTPFARFGDAMNVIAIRVDATAMEGWWYEGAGLYRHAWLVRRAPCAIQSDGVHCDPCRDAQGRWHVPVTATLANVARAVASVTVTAELLDPEGNSVATAQAAITVPVLEQADAVMRIDLPAPPRLWSVDSPTLYTVRTRVLSNGESVDERNIAIGFRTIRFDADRGFLLNGQPVKLKGVCLHQDHAGIGVAVPDAMLAWRLERLKAMGCNAIRMSHNAPNAELLDWCDRMGFLVMDENRQFNPAPEPLAELEWMVRRDRNHPSVILWSVFNEEPMQGTESGVEMVRRMVAAVRDLDDARPITAAMNGAFYDPVNVSSEVDVMGFNYYQDQYDKWHRLNPAMPMTSSEDTSAYETRGAFKSDPNAHVITSYDEEATSWGNTHRASWQMIAERPFVAGGFVWTGFDYHGEPTPYAWPTIASFFGILDLCGFPKTAFGIHAAQWIDDRPVVFLTPHWNWQGKEGEDIKVFVITNAETVALRLNGRDLGVQRADRITGNVWQVPFEPGRIEAIAMTGGKVVASDAKDTTFAPVGLRLTPARDRMAGDGIDCQPVTIDAIDAAGRHVPTANLMTHFTVEGAEILGVGNGNPNSHESEKGNQRSLFNGLAQMIIRADAGSGTIRIRATAKDLEPALLEIARTDRPEVPQVAVPAAELALDNWRRSPVFIERPEPDTAPADGDNNSWAFVHAGTPTPAEDQPGWRVYRASFAPWKRMVAKGARIRFERIAGSAELWVDGVRTSRKNSTAPGPLTATLPAGPGERSVVLLVEAPKARESGITGTVTVVPL